MNPYKKIIYSILLVFLGFMFYLITHADEIPTDSVRGIQLQKDQPFHIKHADHLRWEKNNMAILSGKVELYLEKDQITIAADTIWYYPDTKIYKAAGNVQITKIDVIRGKIVAVSKKAQYDQNQNRIVMEGKPKVFRGNDELTGDILTLVLDKEGTTLEGENVSGIFYPEPVETKSQ